MDFYFVSDRDYDTPSAQPEPFAYGLARALTQRGHHVMASVPKLSPDEQVSSVNGITVLPENNPYHYWREHRPHSMVVEHLTRRPWFVASQAPAYTAVTIMHHAGRDRYHRDGHRADWGTIARRYHGRPVVTTLPSTAEQLSGHGFSHVSVIPPVHTAIASPVPRSVDPVWIAPRPVTPDDATPEILMAFARHHARLPRARLQLISADATDPYRAELEREIHESRLYEAIQWLTAEDFKKHPEILGRAWAVIMTTPPDDGTGIVLSGYAQETPAVVYDLPGLRDAVEHTKTGLTVRPTPTSLSEALDRLAQMTAYRTLLGRQAGAYAKHFSWDQTAERFLNSINTA